MDEIPTVPAALAQRLYFPLATAVTREVQKCIQEHGSHLWFTIRVEYEEDSFEPLSFCKRCGVRMCREVVIFDDPSSMCLLAVGHGPTKLHRDAANRWREETVKSSR